MSKPDDQEKDKAVLAEQAYIKAFDYEMNCGCCPQCVLTAVKETVGIVTDETIKRAMGFPVWCVEWTRGVWSAVWWSCSAWCQARPGY